MATGYQGLDVNDPCKDDNLTYDWEECETLQRVRAFSISDYGTEYLLNQPSIEYPLVSEPPTLSGIIDSEISNPPQRTISDEEHYIEDDLSSLTDVSDIKVSNAPRQHEYGKERAERNIYDKLYNACLKGNLSRVNDILEKHGKLMQDENEQMPFYAACIGNHTDIVKLLIDTGYDINHQDKEGKTPLHITFKNHTPDFAQTLITKFKANTDIRDKQSWTPLHTAIDRGYSCFSKELSEKFLHQDVDTEVKWIQLHAACFQENTRDVQFLLDADIDVNHFSSAVYTPLHIAVTKSNIDLVTLILDQDVNIDSVTIGGKTPLHIAVDKHDEAIIQKLLSHNADPRLKDAPGNTSLHLAVQIKQEARSEPVQAITSYTSPLPICYHTCSVQTVQAIIDHGADVNAVNNRGETALWFACVDGQDSFVKILIDAGADPNIVDKNDDICLHAAIHGQCSTETIRKIIDHGAHVNAVNNDGATPLLLACSRAQAGSVELLLTLGADPNIADADGDTSILSAIEGYCNVNTMQRLVDNGAKVNATNNKGLTALLKACAYRQMDVVKVLLEAGADPTIVDDVHYSSLHAAVDGRCSKDTLHVLIDYGAHIDATRKDGTNALLRACTTGQSDSVMFLLEAGAGVSITKPNGDTCLHTAVKGKCCKEALQKIIEQGINVNTLNNRGETPLFHACLSAQGESVKLLLEKGADPNITYADGYTSLHTAVHGCCANDALQEIITHGVYVDAQNIDGETALWLACSYRQQDSVKILLEAGANPNIASTDRCTSLHAAVNGGCSKNILSALLDHGADVNAITRNNETALKIACEMGNINSINVLLNAGASPHIADTNGDPCLHYALNAGCSKEILQTIISHGADMNATTTNNVTALVKAVNNRNMGAINVLLNAGADTNITNGDGDTCLHDAVTNGNKDVLQLLLNHGADVNVTNSKNETALMIAYFWGNIDAMNVLLSAGADPNIADANGQTCLHSVVARVSGKEVLQLLINHDADVNATNKSNTTALMVACKTGNIDAINELLNAEADTNIVDTNGYTCLHAAVSATCNKEVLQTLINHGADVNAADKSNVAALMLACEKGNVNAVDILLNAGADPNIPDTDGNTRLHDTVRHGYNREVLQLLLDYGANVNAIDNCNETVLMKAYWNGNTDVINVLLNAGADPNIADFKGVPLIYYAVEGGGSKDVLQAIIDHCADVNATINGNLTPFMKACRMGNADAACLLLKAGADPDFALDDGDTCLHDAVRRGYTKEVLGTMIDHGADVNATNRNNATALMIACKKGNMESINILLNAGADPNISRANCSTCLHDAVAKGCSNEVLQALINQGVDVNATNISNETALMTACWMGNIDAINVLLNAGADPNIACANGLRCLHGAVTKGSNIEILQTIINQGADINTRSMNNETALMIACKTRNEDAIHVLLNAGADLNITDDKGATCIHHAVDEGCSKDVLETIITFAAEY